MTLEEAIEQSDRCFREAGYRIEALSPRDRTIHLITSLNFELSNGGMLQLLLNETGGHVAATIEALQSIGATETALELGKVARTFPSNVVPTDDEERKQLVESLEPAMSVRWNQIAAVILNWDEDVDRLLRVFVSRSA
jgi:hypothetical protein